MAQTPTRNHAPRGHHKQYARMPLPNPQRHVVPIAVLTQSKLVPIATVRPVSTTVPKPTVTRPRQANTVVTKPTSPPRRHINRSLSPKASNFPPKVTVAKAPMVYAVKGGNPQHALKDKGVIDSGCSRHMTGNMSYLSDFEELNGGYVAFGGNPKGGKILGKDENQVLLRVPRENNMYNVDLKNIIPSGDLTCLFAKATVDETLIEATRTMLADSLLSIPFWAEAVNTACYVHNRVLVTKPQNKTPYELLHGRTPSIGFMRPFGCPVTILNTLDSLGKFDGKVDEGFLVGYSISSKAFRVFNSRTHIVQETLHINFLENKPNVVGSGPTWLFDIDTLTKTMNYQPITTGNQSNPSAGVQEQFDAKKAGEENVQQYVLFPVWSSGSTNPQNTDGNIAFDEKDHESEVNVSLNSSAHINEVNVVGTLVLAVRQISTNNTNTFSAAGPSNAAVKLKEITYSDDKDDVGAEADFNNLETSITVSPIPTTRVHKDHPVTQTVGISLYVTTLTELPLVIIVSYTRARLDN
nr:retrovirus-related Pol polyprotein from transposon TNT 1-94 [Tanacetum cinerariifolium]